MTVTYTAEVATSRGFGCFWKLLFRWRGSVYKLVWPDLLLFCAIYTILSFIYRVALSEPQKRYFEKISLYCESFVDLIPIAFVLGFYVSIVVTRWWDSYMTIPWPDRLAIFVTANVHGLDDRGRLMRRTIMRYVNLSLLITFTCISSVVKKRFPTLDHLVEAGILLPNEKKILEEIRTPHPKYWMPLVWCTSLVSRARKEGRIRDDFALKTLLDEINSFRGGCGGLFNYDWISIPLVYTQVVTLAVYTFFMTCLFGRQFLDPAQSYTKHTIDIYIPIFTLLQYLFYMGWLKVAESLVNPFGEDDDDFEMNWLVDRNLQVSYLIVDEMHQEHPELIKDQYWDETMPEMPYTAAAEQFKTEPHMGSAAGISVPDHEANFLIPSSIIEEEEEDLEGNKTVPLEGNSSTPTESHPMRILTRQLSGSSHGSSQMGSSHMTNRPSMLSMLQRMFSRTRKNSNSLSGSQMSLKHPPVRSTSKMSYTSQSPTPQSPTLSHPDQDDIFKMSDLSININKNDDNLGIILDLLEKEQLPHTKRKPLPHPSDSKTKLGKKLSSESNTNQDADHSTKEDSQEESAQNEICHSCNQHIRTKSHSNLEELPTYNISSSSTPSHHKKVKHKKPEKLQLTARDSITSPLLSPSSDLQSPFSTDSPGDQDSKSGDNRPSSPFFSALKKKVHTIISPLARNNSASNLSSPANEHCEIGINESESQNSTDYDNSCQLISGLSTPSQQAHLSVESTSVPSHIQCPLKKHKQESISFAELSTILEQGSPDSESHNQPKIEFQTIDITPSSNNNSQRSHSIPNRLSDHGNESHLLISKPTPSRKRTISEGTVLQPKSSLSRFFSFKKN